MSACPVLSSIAEVVLLLHALGALEQPRAINIFVLLRIYRVSNAEDALMRAFLPLRLQHCPTKP